jgi:hypothetical protein
VRKPRGLEANWVQPLGRWLDLLDGFGYTINYTHITQHGDGAGAAAQARRRGADSRIRP